MCAHDRRLVVPHSRDMVDDPLAWSGTAVPLGHGPLRVALVEEGDPIRIDFPH